MSKLADAVLRRLDYINKVEYRPASYADLKGIEFEGKMHEINYDTLRNIICVLKKGGSIERYYNSRASFFVLKGVKFGKQLTNHVLTEHSKSQLSEAIQQLPESNRGFHDIHLLYQAQDIWTVLSESKKYKVDECNKGILLSHFNIDGLKITANIHHTDTVTVTAACSNNPVSTKIDDVDGVVRLTTALARTQERTQRIVDECGQLLPGGYESIIIPDINTWKLTMIHFAVDSPNYREEKTCMTWKTGLGILLREYSKKNDTLRNEQQVYPNITFGDFCKGIINNLESDMERESISDPSSLHS